MKIFIDIRGQGTGYNFAWWDTVRDIFEKHSGEYSWGIWEEFERDYEGNDLTRYKSLCPRWVFINRCVQDLEEIADRKDSLSDLAHDLWTAAQVHPSEGIADAIERITTILMEPKRR